MKFIIFLLFLLVVPIKGEAGRRDSRRRLNVRETPKPPQYNEHEQKLISLGGLETVKKLREHKYSAAEFIKALKTTVLGIQLYNQGDYGDCIFIFQRSYRIFPSPAILYWIAKSNMKFGNVIMARSGFSRFLMIAATWKVTKIKGALLEDAKRNLAVLEKTLASVRLVVNVGGAEVAVNGIILRQGGKALKTPLRDSIWLRPGYNQIVVTHKGFVAQQLIILDVKSGQKLHKTVTLLTRQQMIEKSELYRKAQIEKAGMERKRRETEARLRLERELAEKKSRHRQKIFRISGYSVIGAGAALLIGGVILGVMSDNLAGDLNNASTGTPWVELSSEYDKYTKYQSYSRYAMGIGGAVILGGAVLAYFGLRQVEIEEPAAPSKKVALTPLLGGGFAGMALSFGF